MSFHREARRVREFFWREVAALIEVARILPPKHLKELLASHRFLFLKSLQIPTHFASHIVPKKQSMAIPQASPQGETHWERRIDAAQSEGRGLAQSRVKGWDRKEWVCAKKQLDNLMQAKGNSSSHEFTPFVESDESDPRLQEWQDLLATHEERQFQITRITQILSHS